ncbi:FxsB family radical SAM/SPASM domain protein [Amorphoplanes nipponensis]|uniref:Radical SAM protein n=1 Tax=Actinoplanes nipponensis TaxID=135950 RepID=A0A919JEL2_9ACTN|nr:FxsB family cyclophane-forming radical SAM/SPASM peptide maturase [Actinoplanes nipponensis]GIE49574.1 radical SAM protein [Actinoplanes nipponensis]
MGGSPVRPFGEVVVKVHGRCNLACDYCYVYRHADQSWRRKPVAMSRSTMERLADRLGEHARTHHLPYLRVILHGGEPLLAGADFLRYAVRSIRRALPCGTRPLFTVQTNGVLLDRAVLELFLEEEVRVGVSLDGSRATNDRHRRFAGGRSSHPAVVEALRLLGTERYRQLYAGILCTVDVHSDPLETYEHLLTYRPPAMDLLLPHGNREHPPPARPLDDQLSAYGDWLVAVFDRWYDAPVRETRIRLFESLLDLLLGGHSHTEWLGLEPADIVTVDTDGSIEQSDVLKTVAEDAATTGLHLITASLDDAAAHPGIRARRSGVIALGPECRSCPVVRVCGGGLHAHRYDGTGFANRSVYCPDLYHLIAHAHGRLRDDLVRRPGS